MFRIASISVLVAAGSAALFAQDPLSFAIATPRPINPAAGSTNPSALATQSLNPYLGSIQGGKLTPGEINLTLQDATFFYEPKKVELDKVVKTGEGHEPVVTSASYNPANEMPYRGPGSPVQVKEGEDPTTAATRAFVYCVRTGDRPIADEHVGLGSALAVVSANTARVAKREVEITTS